MASLYAGVGRRAVATLIDGIPLLGIALFIYSQFGNSETQITQTKNGAFASSNFELTGTGTLMVLLFTAFYHIGMELTFGGTIGKLIVGLRVRNADGSPVSVKGAVIRFLFLFIDGLFLYLVAAVMVMATPKNQRLGDLVGGTVVGYRDVPDPHALRNAPIQSWPQA